MNVFRAPQRPEFEIQLALNNLPTHLEPGYQGEPDFYPLIEQIDKLREQQVVLCLAAWIWRNASWLQTEGFLLHRSWLPDGPDAIHMRYVSDKTHEQLFEEAGLPANRHAVVSPLIHRLADLTQEHTWQTIANLVCEFNATRWDPAHAQRMLIEALEGNIDDGEAWLDAHRAHFQASNLDQATPNATGDQARGRL